MSKWFDSVIKNTVEKTEMVNFTHTINYLSEKQTETFKNCMKFYKDTKTTTEYIYKNERYEAILQTSKYRNSLRIKDLKIIEIMNIKGEIEYLKNEIALEEVEEFILEDQAAISKLEIKLKELETAA